MLTVETNSGIKKHRIRKREGDEITKEHVLIWRWPILKTKDTILCVVWRKKCIHSLYKWNGKLLPSYACFNGNPHVVTSCVDIKVIELKNGPILRAFHEVFQNRWIRNFSVISRQIRQSRCSVGKGLRRNIGLWKQRACAGSSSCHFEW